LQQVVSSFFFSCVFSPSEEADVSPQTRTLSSTFDPKPELRRLSLYSRPSINDFFKRDLPFLFGAAVVGLPDGRIMFLFPFLLLFLDGTAGSFGN